MTVARVTLLLVALGLLAPVGAQTAPPESPPDPTAHEVPLPAADGWQASLVHESDVGIWTCGPCKVFDDYGAPEVFGLDDKGRCTILSSYSGKWARWEMVQDNAWLGVFAQVDLDPRLPGDEIYTGGKNGRLYQIRATDSHAFETRVVAEYPGEEIHTLVAGDLVPGRAGNELLLFTRTGLTYELRPDGDIPGTFTSEPRAPLEGRVRQGVLLPTADGEPPWIAAACRTGEILLLRLGPDGSLERDTITREPMGCGRLSLAPGATPERAVLYTSRDDGVILRLEGAPGGPWSREIAYVGPQGPRGVVAGRFVAEEGAESFAVFGYSKRVQLVWRRPGHPWQVQTLFVDRDKGHWLEAIEVDGRNGTDELLASGYGGRIVLLSRAPGYGLHGVPVDPDPDPRPDFELDDTDSSPDETARREHRGEDVPRVAVQARPLSAPLTPLDYGGGFETKSLVFETLVRRDDAGRIVPGLASSWRSTNGGRRLELELRADARFHDGSPVTAESVAWHLRRWLGLPEHAWLRAASHVTSVEVLGPRSLALHLDEAWDVLPELCAINPAAVSAPASRDRDGRLVAAVGSGPFLLVGPREDEPATLIYERVSDGRQVELVRYAAARTADVWRDLLAGRLDVVADGWARLLPRQGLEDLATAAGLRVRSSPGGSLVWLELHTSAGPMADSRQRSRLARDLQAAGPALFAATEGPHADPARSWPFLPTASASARPAPPAAQPTAQTLRLAVAPDDALARDRANALVQVLGARGWHADVITADAHVRASGAWDLALHETWGLPYDPDLSLRAAFLPPSEHENAARTQRWQAHPGLAAAVLASARSRDDAERTRHLRDVADVLAQDVPVVPLYVPRRLVVSRDGVPAPQVGRDLYQAALPGLSARGP